MTIGEFADHIGVSPRMISKWESCGVQLRPFPTNQRALDTSLDQADPRIQARFAHAIAQYATWDGDTAPFCPAPLGPTPTEAVPARPDPPTRPHGLHPLLWHTAAIRQALKVRDIGAVFAMLRQLGVSPRRIAAWTGQSPQDVTAIVEGRRVDGYDALTRISDGLGIDRGLLGLSYCTGHTYRVPNQSTKPPAQDTSDAVA